MANFKVTFWNILANRRGVVLDNLTKEEAESVAARVSDKNDGYTYLPEVRIEEDVN